MTMDFQSAMETFAEAWVAANSKGAPLSDISTQVPKNFIKFIKISTYINVVLYFFIILLNYKSIFVQNLLF